MSGISFLSISNYIDTIVIFDSSNMCSSTFSSVWLLFFGLFFPAFNVWLPWGIDIDQFKEDAELKPMNLKFPYA